MPVARPSDPAGTPTAAPRVLTPRTRQRRVLAALQGEVRVEELVLRRRLAQEDWRHGPHDLRGPSEELAVAPVRERRALRCRRGPRRGRGDGGLVPAGLAPLCHGPACRSARGRAWACAGARAVELDAALGLEPRRLVVRGGGAARWRRRPERGEQRRLRRVGRRAQGRGKGGGRCAQLRRRWWRRLARHVAEVDGDAAAGAQRRRRVGWGARHAGPRAARARLRRCRQAAAAVAARAAAVVVLVEAHAPDARGPRPAGVVHAAAATVRAADGGGRTRAGRAVLVARGRLRAVPAGAREAQDAPR